MNIPESLINRIKQGKCILFLGAGATKQSGGLLGNELAKAIYDQIGDIGVKFNEKLSVYTELLVKKGYRDDIERIVRNRLKELKPSKDFSMLSDIPWKAIYTTNYDDLVEKAYKNSNYFNIITNSGLEEKTKYSFTDIPFFKICGDINSDYNINSPLVITVSDLRNNKHNRKSIFDRLMRDLNDTFVFVGYSFDDPNEIVTEILEELSSDKRWESVKEKYVVSPKLSDEADVILSSYRINHIEGKGDEFFRILSEISNRDYKTKLCFTKNSFQEGSPLACLSHRTQQYIIESFEIYNDQKEYPSDGKYYYRGGRPDWGIIRNQFDISRNITIENCEKKTKNKGKLNDVLDLIEKYIFDCKSKRIFIRGAAASGKTTFLYRLSYELTKKGILALLFRQQAKYKEGLFPEIYSKTNAPFVILSDEIYIDSVEIIKMLNECANHQIPLIFVLTSRNSEWENNVSQYTQNVLTPFDLVVEMADTFDQEEATIFVDKLIESKIITADTAYGKKSLINKFKKDNNIIEVLFELVSENSMENSIVEEYQKLQQETKDAYGIISLIYRYGFKIRWEVLQRALNEKYPFTWEDFIEKILNRDAKGNILNEEIQGYYYLYGRSRCVCDLICKIHYDGNYSDEIKSIMLIIYACSGFDNDEKFLGYLVNAIIKSESNKYNEIQMIELLNCSVDNMENDNNQSFINHLKGEYYISHHKYDEALKCFEENVNNDLNLEYSLQSLGKTYYYKARNLISNPEMFRICIDKAIRKLLEGVNKYKKNESYYSLLISIFNFLTSENKMSEDNLKSKKKTEELALENLGNEIYDRLKNSTE